MPVSPEKKPKTQRLDQLSLTTGDVVLDLTTGEYWVIPPCQQKSSDRIGVMGIGIQDWVEYGTTPNIIFIAGAKIRAIEKNAEVIYLGHLSTIAPHIMPALMKYAQ